MKHDQNNLGSFRNLPSIVTLLWMIALWLPCGRTSAAQFTEINPGLPEKLFPCVAVGDYDGDGDLDVLGAANGRRDIAFSTIYNNTGGVFTDSGIVLLGLSRATAAWGDFDGDGDLDLAMTGVENSGTVTVAEGPYSIAARALVPPQYPAGWPLAFTAVASASNTTATVAYEWDFGDGSIHNTNQHAVHSYAVSGSYSWSLMTRAGAATAGAGGTIVVGDAIQLGILQQPGGGTVSWPRTTADAILEVAAELHEPVLWRASTNSVTTTPGTFEVKVSAPPANGFFRLRQVR